jgi:ell wall binding domain 2 (CWB2)
MRRFLGAGWLPGTTASVPAMRTVASRPLARELLLAATALACIGLGGCGKGGSEQISGGGPARQLAPVAAQGAVSVATRNTTRLGGADVAADAAAVARAVYPGLTAATRPLVAVLVNERDWLPALAASVLASAPTGAPILFSEGDALPAVTSQTLEAMRPLGAPALGGAQVIRIGTTAAVPDGYVTRNVPVGSPAVSAANVEQLAQSLDAGAPHQVIVLPADGAPALAMPAAGLAAESGAPLLYVTRARVPPQTVTLLASLHKPSIYVIDAAEVGSRSLAELRRLGSVRTLTSAAAGVVGESAVQNAIEVARYTNGNFGFGVKEPGHGVVLANASRPLDGPASALLSATGDYGPLLLLESATLVPPVLAGYLSDIQPAYSAPQFPPVRGAYNHGWLIGGERAISAVTQAEIDSVLEIRPQDRTSEEPSVSQVE